MRHNEMRSITAKLMTEVCHNVGVKPTLQPLSGKLLQQKTSNREDDVRLDIVADNFSGDGRRALQCESVSSNTTELPPNQTGCLLQIKRV